MNQTDLERPLPYNIEAEEAVLGSLMIDNPSIEKVISFLRGKHFYRLTHQVIYDALVALWKRATPADPLTLADELDRKGVLEEIGGQAKISDFFQRVPTAIHVVYYAKIVARCAEFRRLEGILDEARREIYAPDADPSKVVAVLERGLMDRPAEDALYIQKPETRRGRIEERLQEAKQKGKVGIPFFLPGVNRLIGGTLYPAETTVIAGMSSVGKSRLGTQLGAHAATFGNRVIHVHSELYAPVADAMYISHLARLDITQTRMGFQPDEDTLPDPTDYEKPLYPYRRYTEEKMLEAIRQGEDKYYSLPIYIYAPDYDPNRPLQSRVNLDPETIRANILNLIRREGKVDLIIVDFLGNLDYGSNESHGQQAMKIKYAVQMFNALAKETGAHIVMFNQMLESALKKRIPWYTDMEGGKEVYQLVDNVLLLISPAEHGEECDKNCREIVVPKGRFGESGVAEGLYYEGAIGWFGDYVALFHSRNEDRVKPLTPPANNATTDFYNFKPEDVIF